MVIIFLSLMLGADRGAQQNCTGCGVAFLRNRIYNRELRDYVVTDYHKDIKFLFYDSMIIAERQALYLNWDTNNRQTWRVEVCGYTFIDFRTKSFYSYRHFSDTARIFFATRQPAKGRVRGGWNFFDPPRVPHTTAPLPDTVVEGTSYHRLKGFFFKNGDTVLSETQFYVSEAERPVAFYGKAVTNGKRFSLIRIESPMLDKRLTYTTMDVMSQNLTEQELKVFAVWKRNATKLPIPKNKEGKIYVLDSNGKFILDRSPKNAARI